MSQYDNNNNRLLKELSLQYLGGKKCRVCGVNYLPMCCYDFHHNKAAKEENISKMIHGKTKLDAELKNELDKCVVLCANCHRQVTTRLIYID